MNHDTKFQIAKHQTYRNQIMQRHQVAKWRKAKRSDAKWSRYPRSRAPKGPADQVLSKWFSMHMLRNMPIAATNHKKSFQCLWSIFYYSTNWHPRRSVGVPRYCQTGPGSYVAQLAAPKRARAAIVSVAQRQLLREIFVPYGKSGNSWKNMSVH